MTPTSPTVARTRGDTVRLLAHGYMELAEPAGAFSCGNCVRFSDGRCGAPCIKAPVSAESGCCDLFKPETTPVFGKAQEC